MQREDKSAFEREVEREHETPEERRLSSEDILDIDADQHASEWLQEPNIEDAGRVGQEDDGP